MSLPRLIHRLWCLHWPGRRDALPAAGTGTGAVVLGTCLRQLAFGLTPRPVLAGEHAAEVHAGPAAYQFLLEVMSGLKSAVPGETNVAGQFREAWQAAAPRLPLADRQGLGVVVDALRADMRVLRATHLQGMAGSSYASLARELLAPRRDARVLFVGTGELARSLWPLFRTCDIAAWNHRPAGGAGLPRLFDAGADAAAAAWATDVIFTTPADPAHDARWAGLLGAAVPRSVVHLGARRGAGHRLPPPTRHFDLDDVFDLASSRETRRHRQFAAALAAAGELAAARLRAPAPRSCTA